MEMKEFKVNDHIILRLENKKTNIYVDGELFDQCKYILMRKTVDELKDLLEDINSVDDLENHLDHSLHGVEPELVNIPPETRFWVHCSNMQVWAENNYDTRLLHSNLSFPLLKKLAELDEPIAKRVFKDEIKKRFSSGKENVMEFLNMGGYLTFLTEEELKEEIAKLIEEGDQDILLSLKDNEYLDHLNNEEIICASLVPEEAEIILELEKLINRKIGYMSLKEDLPIHVDYRYPYYNVQNRYVITLDLSNCKLSEIPKMITRLKRLKELSLGINNFSTIPETIRELDSIGETGMIEGYSQTIDLPTNQYNQYGKQSNLYVFNSQKNPHGAKKSNRWCLVIIIIIIIFTVSYGLSMAAAGVDIPGFG